MKFKQRGNITECVQWNGFNLDEVQEFVLARLKGHLADSPELIEFVETMLKHLIIVANLDINTAIVLGGRIIPRGTWLVDQGSSPENDLGFVICEHQRFKTLYKEIEHDDE